MKIPKWLKLFLIRNGFLRCNHKNCTERTWKLFDGTPMYEIKCHECSYHNRGWVHGDFEKIKED